MVEDRVRGGQGARGEEKDGKHRSGVPSLKKGGIQDLPRVKSKNEKKRKENNRAQGSSEEGEEGKEEVRYERVWY